MLWNTMPDMVNVAERLINLARSQGLIRPCDLAPLEISRVSLTRAVRRGQLERVGRGLYGLPGREVSAHGSLAEVARRVPKGVVYLLSALRFHGLTTQAYPLDNTNVCRYYYLVIKDFANKETAAVFANARVRRLGVELLLLQSARRKLMQTNRVEAVDELRIPPGNRLEKLSGNRDGQWSIRVNDQWRVCFEWRDGHAWNVEIVDYH